MAALAIDTRADYTTHLLNLTYSEELTFGTVTTSFIDEMFTINGMSEIISPSYIDINKQLERTE